MSGIWRNRLLMAVAVVAVAGCNGALSEDEADLGEAASALTAGDEPGDVAPAGAMGDADAMEGAADEAMEPPSQFEADCDFKARKAKVLAQYDANHDGKLGPAEKLQLREDLQDHVAKHPRMGRFMAGKRWAFGRIRWAFDENNDKVLDATERTAMIDAMEARCVARHEKVLAQFDADKNGTLSDDEKAAAKAFFQQQREQRRADLLAKYDANKDGTLDQAERQQARADKKVELQGKIDALKAEFDANADGSLDDAELLALKQEVQRRIASGEAVL